MPTLSLWAATREVGVDTLLGTSSLIRKVGCWRVRQNDEPDRDHLGVTSERDIQGDPGSHGDKREFLVLRSVQRPYKSSLPSVGSYMRCTARALD